MSSAGHLEPVWRQLKFDANWLSAVERVEAESALERFVAWQEARPGQQLLGTEVEFSCEVDLGDERVQLTGSADRVERDPDGRIRIVDFKTSKIGADRRRRGPARPARGLPARRPAGSVRRGRRAGARPGGAELVYLRLPDGAGQLIPKVFQQASLDDVPFPADAATDDRAGSTPERTAGPTWVHGRLAEAASDHPGRAARRAARAGLPLLPVPGQLPGPAGRAAGGRMSTEREVPQR